MHVLPRVGELHERFADVLSVVGVHAGKFTTERRTERIAAASDRLAVHHAVVNDRHYRIWRAYGVQAWPTIALLDAEGHLVGMHAGEFDTSAIAEIIAEEIRAAEHKGALSRGPERYLEPAPASGGVLRYPSRAIETSGRLYVTDTGHGRVLQIELDESGMRGTLAREWGGFAEPQGLAAVEPGSAGPHPTALFVADRAAHSVFALRRDSAEPVRIAGTGRIGERDVEDAAEATRTPLRSPWGLSLARGQLLVTMAGSHQVFSLSPQTPGSRAGAWQLKLVAGSGVEDLRDGLGRGAALAQPTGIASAPPAPPALQATPAEAFVADCEASAVRRIDAGDRVSTVVGTGLFDFGDRDGVGDAARLQHCQDVAWDGRWIVLADTYNDRLKLVDPTTRECRPWPGQAGEAGALREPDGVSASPARGLLVADTGNHRIVRVLPDGSLSPIEIKDGA